MLFLVEIPGNKMFSTTIIVNFDGVISSIHLKDPSHYSELHEFSLNLLSVINQAIFCCVIHNIFKMLLITCYETLASDLFLFLFLFFVMSFVSSWVF